MLCSDKNCIKKSQTKFCRHVWMPSIRIINTKWFLLCMIRSKPKKKEMKTKQVSCEHKRCMQIVLCSVSSAKPSISLALHSIYTFNINDQCFISICACFIFFVQQPVATSMHITISSSRNFVVYVLNYVTAANQT